MASLTLNTVSEARFAVYDWAHNFNVFIDTDIVFIIYLDELESCFTLLTVKNIGSTRFAVKINAGRHITSRAKRVQLEPVFAGLTLVIISFTISTIVHCTSL